MILFKVFLLLVYGHYVQSIELRGLQLLVNLISGDFMESKAKDDDETTSPIVSSKSFSNFSFIDFVTYADTMFCFGSEAENVMLKERSDLRKAPIKVNCLPNRGNGTVHVVGSVKEVVSILASHGNYTKRHLEGNCALILFYTKSCPGSAMVAPHFNALAKQFPDIKIAAIDAFKFSVFNTEFGIVGLPTLMLFHQGRPIVKFNDTASNVNSFIKFITKHTGIKPKSTLVFVTSEDFNGPLSNKVEREPDKYLYLAWLFILFSGCYYFTKSRLYIQIEEMIKRNWRESEAQHEHNN